MLLGLLRVGPGDGLVVEGAVAKAAVQDPDPAVGERAQGLLVGGALGAVTVIASACARRGGKRAKRPPHQRVGEAAVAHEAGQPSSTYRSCRYSSSSLKPSSARRAWQRCWTARACCLGPSAAAAAARC